MGGVKKIRKLEPQELINSFLFFLGLSQPGGEDFKNIHTHKNPRILPGPEK